MSALNTRHMQNSWFKLGSIDFLKLFLFYLTDYCFEVSQVYFSSARRRKKYALVKLQNSNQPNRIKIYTSYKIFKECLSY